MSHNLTDIVILWNGCALGILFLLRGSWECAGRDQPHWSAIICMLNTLMAPWCWRGTLALQCAAAARSRVPKLPYEQTHTDVHSHTLTHIHIPREPLSTSVLFHVFILGLLMRRVVSGILSGPSDLSVVFQPSSPFDLQEMDWTAVVVLQHSLLAGTVDLFRWFPSRLPLVTVYICSYQHGRVK